ncbi:hypothetical protein VSDG_09699 [Cytospora chrysosperma]|uniref:Nephrocystin 3-like N-terminal domain-containing protein n=1 Tax=Cytospora chrysosperma TaxID=252740 RepID=A0A423V973_CYTCH|nr:hypothetical protein VSDG_09699 [Valsa sordida]
MAQRSSVIAQETEDGISSKTKRVYRALVNSLPWRRGSGVGSEHDQSLAKEGVLPTGSDSIAERRSEPPPDRGSLDDKAVPTADGDINAQKQEDGAPDVDTSLAPPPAKDRDLWDEAWKSNDLDEEARNRLQRPWNHFSDTTQSLLEVPKRDKNAKRRDKPTQGGLRGENTTKTSDYNQCVDDVIHGLQFRQEEYPTQWEGSKDTAKKILTSVLTIKKIIDAGVAFDPTGYGASAWAVVSFGLTLIQNSSEMRDEAFQATAFLSELLARYSRYEDHYRRVKFTQNGTEELEDAIVQVYVAILAYSNEVKKADDGSINTRIKQSFIALTENPLLLLKGTIQDKDEIVEKWKDLVDKKYEEQFQEHVEKSLGGIEDQATAILGTLKKVQDDSAAARKYAEILSDQNVLDWLCNAHNTSANRHQNLRRACFKWKGGKDQGKHQFLQEKQYIDWKRHTQSVLWLYAPPGSGKSSLCCSVVEDLADDYDSKTQQKHVVYWYFQSGTTDSKDTTPVIRSFLRQLCSAKSSQHKFPKDIQDWLLRNCNRNPPPSTEKFLDKVIELIKALRLDIFIITRNDILDLIHSIFKDANANLHILLVSKFEDNIQRRLQQEELKEAVVEMDVRDVLKAELHDFIDLTLKHEVDLASLPEGVKEKIRDRLKKGEESFVWAVSLLDDLRKSKGNKRKIKRRLQMVPETMAKKYDQILDSVSQAKKPMTRIILMWLLRHKRAGGVLTQDELAAAARMNSASDVSELPIKAMMITLDRDDMPSRAIEFESPAKDHLQERLQKKGAGGDNSTIAPSTTSPWLSFSDTEAHLEIATRCLEVLLYKDDKNQRKRSALKSYAAQYWHEHYLAISESPPNPNSKEVHELDHHVQKLFTPGCAAFKSWLRCCDPDKDFEPSKDFDLTSEDDDGSTKSVDTISHNNDDEDSDEDGDEESEEDSDEDSDSQSDEDSMPRADPVYYAVKLGLLDMAIRMIEQKAPYAQPGFRDGPHGTSLYIASAKAEDDMVGTIVKHLIEKGARADGNRDGKYGSALHVAAYFGRCAAVRLLLEEGGAIVDQEGGMFGTALHAAAAKGHTDVVRELLDHKADPMIVSGLLGTALQAALTARSLNVSTLELLQAAIETKTGPAICSGIGCVNRSSISWKPAVDRLDRLNPHFFASYKQLFPMPSPKGKDFQMPDGDDLDPEQEFLASVLEIWALPRANVLIRYYRDQIGDIRPYYSTVQDQLDDIERVLPNFENRSREQELNGQDFRFKALFWSGVHYILESAVERVYSLRRYANLARRIRYNIGHYRWLPAALEGEVNMEFGDNLALEIARQQQLLSQNQSSQNGQKTDGMTKLRWRLRATEDKARMDGDENESDGDGNIPMHLILDSLLPLVKDIIGFGKECDQLHATAAQRDSDGISAVAAKTNADLTFELFAAVTRLAMSIEHWHQHRRHHQSSTAFDISTYSLAETVRLLRTVRLARITKLAAVIKQQSPNLQEMLRPVLNQHEDQIFERMQGIVRDTVRVELERQQNRNAWVRAPTGGRASDVLRKRASI